MKEYGIRSIEFRCERERSFQCRRCQHYRQCVAKHYYCPPYSLAILHQEASFNHPDYITWSLRDARERAFKNYYDNELTELHKNGFRYEDFCKTCRFKCKADLNDPKSKKCHPLEYIQKYISCPTAGGKK